MFYLSKSLYLYIYSQSVCRQYSRVITGAPGDADWKSLQMHVEAMFGWTGRCTWRPWSSGFGHALGGRDWVELSDALGGPDCAGFEMHLEAVIERGGRWISRARSSHSERHLEALIAWVWRFIWRPRSSNSEMHLEAVIERVWRCTWRPRSSWTERCTSRLWSREFREALGGHDRVTQRCTRRPW